MTESEWLASDDPRAMLEALRTHTARRADGDRIRSAGEPSDRKLRLLLCALWRSRWGQLIPECRASIARVERGEWDGRPDGSIITGDTGPSLRNSLLTLDACHRGGEPGMPFREQAAVLRDLVGNPFRPVRWSSCDHCHGTGWRTKIDRDNPGGSVSRPCRKCGPNPTVLSLATAAYEDRLPDGALDPVRLMVLADAMEEAGCEEGGGLLAHLRGQCPVCKGAGSCAREDAGVYYWPCEMCDATGRVKTAHYRGCHVLDLILGRE